MQDVLGIEVLVAVCWRRRVRLRTHPHKVETAWRGDVNEVPDEGNGRGDVDGIEQKLGDGVDGEARVRRVMVH